jgi:hypothetical protein
MKVFAKALRIVVVFIYAAGVATGISISRAMTPCKVIAPHARVVYPNLGQ